MPTRRQLLTTLLTAAGASLLPQHSLAQQDSSKPRRIGWRNWSGSQSCQPSERTAPASLTELQQLIKDAPGKIRAVGAGHSFMPLVPTDGTLLSLSRLSGLIDADADSLQATFWSGTCLRDIGAPLEAAGQALVTMPDIDKQTLAGCISTATHGTGTGIGCMSSLVESLQLVTADGDLLDCSADKNPEIFQAAKVSLGSLGIITKIRMQNQAPYRLKRETVWCGADDVLDVADAVAEKNRNFEFYYIPFTGMGWTDMHNVTDEPLGETERLDSNEAAQDLKTVRDMLGWSPKLRELIMSSYIKTLDHEVRVESSWKNYASERNVRFNEMEYHLPRENGIKAMREVRDVLENNFSEVRFPIEFRYVAADGIWLSPFYQRPCCSIAVHRYFEEDYKPYFAAIEPIFHKYGGRPHWGKLNTLGRDDFAALYPRWQDFIEVRRQLDPQGKFLNPYLESLLA